MSRGSGLGRVLRRGIATGLCLAPFQLCMGPMRSLPCSQDAVSGVAAPSLTRLRLWLWLWAAARCMPAARARPAACSIAGSRLLAGAGILTKVRGLGLVSCLLPPLAVKALLL